MNMKRTIIRIDQEKCNGCGVCIPVCPEGALQIKDGKARLVKDSLCDGFGACIGRCPQDAITIETREADAYDESSAMEHVIKKGEKTVDAHMAHLKAHEQKEYLEAAARFLAERDDRVQDKESRSSSCNCPGAASRTFDRPDSPPQEEASASAGSELRQWPVQLHLVNPQAPYFKNADLLIAADCVPFAFADFHRKFLKNKVLIIFCPKLDHAHDAYLEKLTSILRLNDVKSVTLVHMEVPCCFGLNGLVEEAVQLSGKNTLMKEYTISLRGEVI